jgi:hypothetical protein
MTRIRSHSGKPAKEHGELNVKKIAMIKNTKSVTVTRTTTVLYDSNGRRVSQVKVKEVKKTKGETLDLFKEKLNNYLDEKENLKKPVLRDQTLFKFNLEK